jgi:hypothetical protein
MMQINRKQTRENLQDGTCKNQENMTQKGGNQTEGNERNEESVDVESGNGDRGNLQMGELPSAANVSEGETNAV